MQYGMFFRHRCEQSGGEESVSSAFTLKHTLLPTSLLIPTHVKRKFKKNSSPFTCLKWPRGFQEVKVPRFHDNDTGWW